MGRACAGNEGEEEISDAEGLRQPDQKRQHRDGDGDAEGNEEPGMQTWLPVLDEARLVGPGSGSCVRLLVDHGPCHGRAAQRIPGQAVTPGHRTPLQVLTPFPGMPDPSPPSGPTRSRLRIVETFVCPPYPVLLGGEMSSNPPPLQASVPVPRPAGFLPLLVFLLVLVLVGAVVYGLVFWTGPLLAPLTFREEGLPSGRAWSASVNNASHLSTNDTMVLRLAPGALAYQLSLVTGTDYVPNPASGHLVLTMAGATVSATFVRSKANVTLQENGLPNGVIWGVGEGSSDYLSNRSSMTLTEADGNHSLRILAPTDYRFNISYQPGWIDNRLFLPSVARLDLLVNGSDVEDRVNYSLAVDVNTSFFPVPVFPNGTALGTPAYDVAAVTLYRYGTVNFSFNGYGVLPYWTANVTAYLMTPSQFASFRITGNATDFLLASGNVSQGSWSVNLPTGLWYFIVTGWSIDEYRSGGFGWEVTFPGVIYYLS